MSNRHHATVAAAAETGESAAELYTSHHLHSFMHDHDHALVSMLQVSSGIQDMGKASEAAGGTSELRASQYFELIEDPLLNLLVPIIIKIIISLAKQPIMLVLCQLLSILLANLLATPMAEAIFPGLGLQMPGAGASAELQSSLSPLARNAMAAFSAMMTTTTTTTTSSTTKSVPAMLLQEDVEEADSSAWNRTAWSLSDHAGGQQDEYLNGLQLDAARVWQMNPDKGIRSSSDSVDVEKQGSKPLDRVSIRAAFIQEAADVVRKQRDNLSAKRDAARQARRWTNKPPHHRRVSTYSALQAEVQASGSVSMVDSPDGASSSRLAGTSAAKPSMAPSLMQTGSRAKLGAATAMESAYGACGARKSRSACVEQPLPDGSICSWCEADVIVEAGGGEAEGSKDQGSKDKNGPNPAGRRSRVGRCVMCRGAWGSTDYDPGWRHAKWAGAVANNEAVPAPAPSLLEVGADAAGGQGYLNEQRLEDSHAERVWLQELRQWGGASTQAMSNGSETDAGSLMHVTAYTQMSSSGQGPAIPAEHAALATAKGLEALKAPDGSDRQLWHCSPRPVGDDACIVGQRPPPPDPRPALDKAATEASKELGSTDDPGQKVPPGFIRSNEWGPIDPDPPSEPFMAEPIVATNSISQRVSAAAIEAGGDQIVGAVLQASAARFGRALRSRLSRRLLESVTPTLVSSVLQRAMPSITKDVRALYAKQAAARLTRTAMVAASPAIAAALTSSLGRSPAQDYFCALCQEHGVRVAEFATGSHGHDSATGSKDANGGEKGANKGDEKGDKPSNQLGASLPGVFVDPGELEGPYCEMCYHAQRVSAKAARRAWDVAYSSATELARQATYGGSGGQGTARGASMAAASSSFGGPSGPLRHPDRAGSDSLDDLEGSAAQSTPESDALSSSLGAFMHEPRATGLSPAAAARDAARAAVLSMARDRGVAALAKAGVGDGKSPSVQGAADGGVSTQAAREEQLGSLVDSAAAASQEASAARLKSKDY